MSDELERLRAEVADYKRANAALYEQVRALTSGEVLDAALDSLTRAERERDEKGRALTNAEARVRELEGAREEAESENNRLRRECARLRKRAEQAERTVAKVSEAHDCVNGGAVDALDFTQCNVCDALAPAAPKEHE